MNEKDCHPQRKVFIMVASGFEESAVATCVENLRCSGVSVSLVGLRSRLTSGKHGLTMEADKLLGEVEQHIAKDDIIILPGAQECITSLLSDPRVHSLIRTVLDKDGTVAATRSAEMMTKTVAIPNYAKNQFIPQGQQSIPQFVDSLIRLASV